MIHTDTIQGLSVRWTLVAVDSLTALEPIWQEGLARASHDEVFRGYVEGHTFQVPEALAWATSVAVAVIPFPHRILPFTHRGQHREITLPSPYYQGKVTRPMVREHLEHQLSTRVQEAPTLPYKLLAASCGLGRYGRNGIIYAEGLGTAHSLAAFWTLAPPPSNRILAPEALALCESCGACIRQCPTGAIPDQFGPIQVEKCVPLWNEQDRDLPDGFPPSSSNALVGCLACQRNCPANVQDPSSTEMLPELSEQETALLLGDGWNPDLRRVLGQVLSLEDEAALREWAPVVRRNFAAFLEAHSSSKPGSHHHPCPASAGT